MSLIKKIQKKSRSTRVLILWLTSIFVMGIVIVIWLFTFSQSSTKEEIKESELPSLFESLRKDFSDFKETLNEEIEEIEEINLEEYEEE